MQIVTDSGTDYPLASGYSPDKMVHIVPLNVQLGSTSFKDGEDASREKFYQDLETSRSCPPPPSLPPGSSQACIANWPKTMRTSFPFTFPRA